MTSWSEIRQLANQLKQTQDQTSSNKLFERTWVDIIRHLVHSNRLKLVFTTDGRSYLTLPELDKEIREEVEAHAGRLSLPELASNLGVDLGTIESRLLDLISSDAQSKSPNRLISLPGEVVNEAYVRRLAHDIQDKLEQHGQSTVGELSTNLGLPTAFIVNLMHDYQGTLFHVSKYGDKYLTDTFMNRTRAKIRGYFTALLRPVTLNMAAAKLQIPENLLASIVSSLISNGRLNGSLAAGRGTYIPTCFTQAENAYVDEFFNQNGYVEWNYLKRFGIADPGSYLKLRFPHAIHVTGLTLGSLIRDQLKDLIDEAVSESSWTDLSHCLPTCLGAKERLALLDPLTKHLPVKSIDDGLIIVSDSFVQNCEHLFEPLLKNQASMAFEEQRKLGLTNVSGLVETTLDDDDLDDKQTSKRSSGSAKGGFGLGAREIKTKNVKKKYNPSKRSQPGSTRHADGDRVADASASASHSVEGLCSRYMDLELLVSSLTEALPKDVPVEVVRSVVDLLLPKLHQSFVKSFDSMSTTVFDAGHKRAQLVQTQETINNMLLSIQLLERGIRQIDHSALQTQLLRHLIKDHGSRLIGQLGNFIAQDLDIPWPPTKQPDQPTSPPTPALNNPTPNATPNEAVSWATCQHLVELLKHLGTPTSTNLVGSVQRLVDHLRPTSTLVDLSDFYASLQALAVEQLGLKLPTLNSLGSSRSSDAKRDRDQRPRAQELAIQVELQLKESLDELESSSQSDTLQSVTKAALAATCLFGHVLVGWPITAPGKCVPELVQWLQDHVGLTNQGPVKPTHPTAKAWMTLLGSQAVPQLARLTALIAEHVRLAKPWDEDRLVVLDLVKSIVSVASQCRKQLYVS